MQIKKDMKLLYRVFFCATIKKKLKYMHMKYVGVKLLKSEYTKTVIFFFYLKWKNIKKWHLQKHQQLYLYSLRTQ